MQALPEVLIDATLLRTGSGLYGIGRVTHDLLHGLANIRPEWEGRMKIAALGDLDLRGRGPISDDLAGLADEAMAARGTASGALFSLRRAYLGSVTRRRGAALLHMPEMRGTPILAKVPRISTCHDLIELRDPRHYLGVCLRYPDRWLGWRAGYPLVTAMERHRYHEARRIVAISNETRDDLVRFLGIEHERIDVVPNGIDLARFRDRPSSAAEDRAVVDKYGLGARPFVLYVGSCDYRKNVPTMLAALEKIRQTLDVDLAWAGGLPARKLAAARRQIREAGVGAHVKMLGFVPDAELPSLFRGALSHLFLSRIEGFGLTVIESMIAGCPVVLARGSGCDEMAGDAARVVDADDAEGAAAAVVALSRDATLRARCIERGKLRAEAYGRERMARGYVDSYARALGAHAPNAG
jgi:glycosyltransferase involved in cell wall biosynthesis